MLGFMCIIRVGKLPTWQTGRPSGAEAAPFSERVWDSAAQLASAISQLRTLARTVGSWLVKLRSHVYRRLV